MRIAQRARQAAKRGLARAGLSVGRYSNTLAGARRALLRSGEIAVLVDVGAHKGEYASAARAAGYRGPIVSFEPVGAHFEALEQAAAGDPAWRPRKAGVGAEAKRETINVSSNDGFSSSLLEMDEAHVRALASSRYQRREEIDVVTLDEELGAEPGDGDWYLKVDTQGYEQPVLEGAEAVLGRCAAVELELSVRQLYEGQALIGEMLARMREAGFAPTHLEPEFVDPASGELLQVNGLFRRL